MLPFAGSTPNIAAKLDLGVHIPMFHSNGRSRPFIPSVVCIWDDNCDLLALKKSILKEADYKIGLTDNWVVWNLAEKRLDRPLTRIRKQTIDPQVHGKGAQQDSGKREA